MSSYKVPCALTIAGSDSSGGSGIQADLKTFSSLGVVGASVVTVITSQSPEELFNIYPIPTSKIHAQLTSVLDSMPIRAVKIGVVYSSNIARTVSDCLKNRNLPIVLDPIIRATSGHLLVTKKGLKALVDNLLPIASVITPNIHEAEFLSKMSISSISDMRKAAEAIASLGPEVVVIKGGHLDGGRVVDVAYINGQFATYTRSKLPLTYRGTGCTFSSAIAAYLAKGLPVADAVSKAEKYIESLLRHPIRVNSVCFLNHSTNLIAGASICRVIKNLKQALCMVRENEKLFLEHIADVGTQIAMALPFASDYKHIYALFGRIKRENSRLNIGWPLKAGASKHMASVILTAMKYDISVRAAMNLKYSDKLLDLFRKTGCVISDFSRREEPQSVKLVEGQTLKWGTEHAIRKIGKVPDVIFDLGEKGKEPMIRVLGKSATDVVRKSLRALRTGYENN